MNRFTSYFLHHRKKKGIDLTQSWQKPLHQQKILKRKVTSQKRHQNCEYKTFADRLTAVSLSNGSHSTGVVKPVYGIPTFPSTAKAV